MPSTTIHRSAFGLALTSLFLVGPVSAQETNPVHTHVGHVADSFRNTPESRGLLPTAVAEAEIAHQHATLAGRDPADLEAMKRHMAHVLHALDPAEVAAGPGLGYGVVAAATGAARHIELAAASDGASEGVKTHALHVATAAAHALSNAEAAVRVAKRVQRATEASAAAEMLTELTTLTRTILEGVDADGDGRTGWQESEGGLAQATQHLGLLKRGEGLGG